MKIRITEAGLKLANKRDYEIHGVGRTNGVKSKE
jgi:hypothetical protein